MGHCQFPPAHLCQELPNRDQTPSDDSLSNAWLLMQQFSMTVLAPAASADVSPTAASLRQLLLTWCVRRICCPHASVDIKDAPRHNRLAVEIRGLQLVGVTGLLSGARKDSQTKKSHEELLREWPFHSEPFFQNRGGSQASDYFSLSESRQTWVFLYLMTLEAGPDSDLQCPSSGSRWVQIRSEWRGSGLAGVAPILLSTTPQINGRDAQNSVKQIWFWTVGLFCADFVVHMEGPRSSETNSGGRKTDPVQFKWGFLTGPPSSCKNGRFASSFPPLRYRIL